MLPFSSPNDWSYICHCNCVMSGVLYKWSHIPCHNYWSYICHCNFVMSGVLYKWRHFCNWLFLLSIMPLFIVILQRWNRHPMQNLVWMSNFDLDATHSPRGYGSVYYSHNEAFWWEQNILPIRYQNVYRKKEEGQLSLSFVVIREWHCGEGFTCPTVFCLDAELYRYDSPKKHRYLDIYSVPRTVFDVGD